MYTDFSPSRIFFWNDIDLDPDALSRAERLMSAYPNGEVIRFGQENLADVMVEHGLGSKRPRMGMKDVGDPDLLLTVARFTDPEADAPKVSAICERIDSACPRFVG